MQSASKLLINIVLIYNLIVHIACHGFISYCSADGGKFEKAQKTPLSDTSFRGASSNTGWIGSKFIDSESFTCGSSDTPKGTVAPPGGTIFSRPEQSAKKTLKVKAGGKVDIIISGEKGKGFPHPKGHIETFLGNCGPTESDCQNFDASKAKYFKIQSEMDGISNSLRTKYNSELDGNPWGIPIPSNVQPGSYIIRVQMIAFGQSGEVEGNQDQYYVYCGQIFIDDGQKDSTLKSTTQFIQQEPQDLLSFPGAYKTGNIDPKTLPDPINVAASSSADDVNSGVPPKATDKDKLQIKSVQPPSISDDGYGGNDQGAETVSKSEPSKIACADKCYKATLPKIKDFAKSCTAEDFNCLCNSPRFIKAYENCCKDNCDEGNVKAAIKEIHSRCDSAGPSRKRSKPSNLHSSTPLSTDRLMHKRRSIRKR
ncbi:glycosyl hydrolase family 61-domain-containing protein [Phakopsora pachyrhizi]|uniref:lytic cellulose monooxygenase (C4-dehydrogenating) n=1 Tax=Phakopsora pachyrhizi TaxID=170000 RepID=A0AAV0B8H7_PHAPC|nr:glycosyl hydrolase family 61-domain-containing protein [Phakopsora pachyrhizi]CAH7682771.1 glycosyl hydrolase family 61-domain-containing protein [Phakopsora pachyrhizi]